jgi:glycosyltransferase involved in cell wall biosynthesis
MTSPHHHDAFQELIARGLIAGHPKPQSLALGNIDRKDASRTSWRVSLPAGGEAKLTLGGDLSALTGRHAALAKACPAITTAQLGYVRLPSGDALLESFFEGPTLESAAAGHLLPATVIRQALANMVASLASTEEPSTETARAAEWSNWSKQLIDLPVWQPGEASSLAQVILPGLYSRVANLPATTRWTNGDFLPANILLNAQGESRLIDAEFAARTHFFAEDSVRFRVLSPLVHEHPDLLAGLLPEPALPWHLFFWLRQFQLEIEHNSPAYLARVRESRLGLIRRLAEQVLEAPLPGWSALATAVENRVEDIRWLPEAREASVSGWCHVPAANRLRSVVAMGPLGTLAKSAPADRPDVQLHFAGVPGSLNTGFSLRVRPLEENFPLTLCAVVDHGTLVPFRVLGVDSLPEGALFWEDYPAWAARDDPDPTAPASAPDQAGPLLSILLPVYKTPEAYLRACIGSVLGQNYRHWELCVVDDGSASSVLKAILHEFAATDVRIRVQTRESNGGISRATNDALAMARGMFVLFLDHDDLLRPHALAEFAARLGREPELDALYSDEDKITAEGQRLIPFLKPDYSPEFLLGVMYIGHLLCIRATVARAAGGFDPTFDGIQDYEFFLRVTEQTGRIGHIPLILYHWRQSPGSSALQGNAKGDMDKKQSLAVQAHLRRRGDPRTTRPFGGHRVRLENPARPTVDIIQAADPVTAVALLRAAAVTSNAEVLVLLSAEPRRIVDPSLAELTALASLPDSGCVAPLLLSVEGRVYESGQVGSLSIMRGFHPESDGYHGSLRCNREVDMVSPACVAVRRKLVVEELGPLPNDWTGFCAHLSTRGFFHRVCAASRVQLSASQKDDAGTAVGGTRRFYHPYFDSQKGNYTLTPRALHPTAPAAGLEFFVDRPISWKSLPRCLICRGWCFNRQRSPITGIRLRIADFNLSGVTGLSRPDVPAVHSEAPDEFVGFEIRGTLPAGRHQLHLEARLADGSWKLLMTDSVAVQGRTLPLWLGGGDWMELMFFQMPAHMAYPSRPLRLERFPKARVNASRPKLSVVTPSYNQARFLGETMRSVLDQSNVSCDYVVQDGGSTDGSAKLIQGQAGRLHAWASESDTGQAEAIARGFAKTSGAPDDLMAWINSDDFYLPGALGYVASYFADHPGVDVIYGHRIVVNDESQEIGRWHLPQHDPEVLRLNDFVPQETLFWRRRIWDQVGGIDTSFKFALDWDLLLRFQAAGARIVRVPFFLGCFRVHAAQKTSARMHDVGQREITLLRERTQGRPFPPAELERNPRLLRYLRRSAFIEWLWSCGIRAR